MFTYDIYDYTSNYKELLKNAGKCTMLITRIKAIVTDVFKSYHNLNPDFISCIYDASNHHYMLRNDMGLIQPKVRTTRHGINSIKYQGALMWNNLPTDIKSASSLADFKNLLNKWPGPTCNCNTCVLCLTELI